MRPSPVSSSSSTSGEAADIGRSSTQSPDDRQFELPDRPLCLATGQSGYRRVWWRWCIYLDAVYRFRFSDVNSRRDCTVIRKVESCTLILVALFVIEARAQVLKSSGTATNLPVDSAVGQPTIALTVPKGAPLPDRARRRGPREKGGTAATARSGSSGRNWAKSRIDMQSFGIDPVFSHRPEVARDFVSAGSPQGSAEPHLKGKAAAKNGRAHISAGSCRVGAGFVAQHLLQPSTSSRVLNAGSETIPIR